LADAVLVAEGVEAARLRAEVLYVQHTDAREPLILLPGHLYGTVPLLFGLAGCADLYVNLSGPERLVPILGIVHTVITKLIGPRSYAKASGKLRSDSSGTPRATSPE
jgi:hypothetical protein